MYKLVVIAGKLRGEEFILKEGENTFGRSEDCDINFSVEGVSRHHLTINVTGDVAYVKDNESANGTFVNDKVIKRMTVQDKDRITLPDSILQVVYVREEKKLLKDL